MRQRGRNPSLGQLLFAGLLGVCAATACGQLLGDIAVDREAGTLQPRPPGAGGSPTGNDVPCEPGETRCDEEGTLQACVQLVAGQPGGWLPQTRCGSPELCIPGNPATCVAASCQAGEGSCEGATPRACNASRTGWEDGDPCESAAHCSTRAEECPGGAPCCLLDPCDPGALRCNEGRLEECQADLSGWSEQATCETPELCLSGLAACGPDAASCGCQAPTCAVGETRCSGSALEICNEGRTGWDPVNECGTAALCELGRAQSPARCQPPACALGQFLCDGGTLRSCREDLTDYEFNAACIGPAFCNAAAGVCDPAPCEPGERSCNGAQIQVCADDQTGFVPEGFPCATAELCNDNIPGIVRCDTPVCAVDQFDCFGSAQLQVCNDGRTGFENAAPLCLRPDLCSAARRRCDFCFPGRQECTIDQQSTRVCALSGNFFGPETFCPLGCVAATGLCRTCNIGDYSCTNGNLSRCNDGRSFTPLNRGTDCANGQQVSCFNGTVLRNNCGAGLVCGGTGQCLCNLGDATCDGDDLLVCTGTAFVLGARCQGLFGDILTTCDNGDLETDACDSAETCEDSEGSTCDD